MYDCISDDFQIEQKIYHAKMTGWNKQSVINQIHVYFYKHMKFRNQAWLCLAIYDFEAHIMLSLC